MVASLVSLVMIPPTTMVFMKSIGEVVFQSSSGIASGEARYRLTNVAAVHRWLTDLRGINYPHQP